MKLNTQRRRFCQHYAVHGNETKAAIHAKYSRKTAPQIGCRLLKNVNVKKYIKQLQKRQEKRAEKTADEIIAELEKIAFSNILDCVELKDGVLVLKDIKDIPEEARSSIQSISQQKNTQGTKTGLKMSDKAGALHKLGLRYGIFPNKTDLNIEGDIPLEINITRTYAKGSKKTELGTK